MSRHNYKDTETTDSFICRHCGMTVAPPESGGRQRNHCPHCLWSLHVDLKTGDRRCACRGLMEPISVWVKGNKEWSILHRCQSCGTIRSNRIAGDDNNLILFKLAAEPITMLPFPPKMTLEKIV